MDCIVNTKSGAIKGYMDGGVAKFHAIPYAKPPVGALRFCEPCPPEPWEGVLDATKRGYAAPQYPSDLDKPMGPIGSDTGEDCLTIAVSSPCLDASLPVAVWFHGGANCYCGGDLPWYDGGSLARTQNIVEVNVNFRLGALGFMHVKGVIEKTLSIEDQILALRWIQENISAFGGDPSRVTLFGQSAGANAIAHILSREDTVGLFNQIVLESPSIGRGNHLLADAFRVGSAVLKNLNIDESKGNVLSELQTKTPQEILDASDAVPQEIKAEFQGMFFKPVMDEWHTPEQTAVAAAKAAAKRGTRIMIGFTREETHAFSEARDPESLKKLEVGQYLRYDIPGRQLAKTAAEMGCDVWKYRFEWQAPESIYHSCHCLELPFLFGNMSSWNAPFLAGATAPEMETLKESLQNLWGTFFRGESYDSVVWPKYNAATRRIKFIDNISNPVGDEPDYPI